MDERNKAQGAKRKSRRGNGNRSHTDTRLVRCQHNTDRLVYSIDERHGGKILPRGGHPPSRGRKSEITGSRWSDISEEWGLLAIRSKSRLFGMEYFSRDTQEFL